MCSSVEGGVGTMELVFAQELLGSSSLTLVDTTRTYKAATLRLAEGTTEYTL